MAMSAIKPLLLAALFVLSGVGGCLVDAGSSEESTDECDAEVFEALENRDMVRVLVRYDMEYTGESSLSEEEAAAQRERIQKMHEKLVAAMEAKGLDFHVNRKLRISRLISVTVDVEGVQFLCEENGLVERVSLSEPEKPL